MSGLPNQLPARNTSFQEPSGQIAPVWWNFLFRQWVRTGGGTFTGTVNDFLLKAGGVMTGFLTLFGNPTQPLHAATKQYVDAAAAGVATPPTTTLPAPVGAALTGVELKYAHGDHVHGTSGQHGYIARIWESGAVVANGTYYGGPPSLFPFTINSLDAVCSAGSFTLAIMINGVPVTGLGAVTVNGVPTNTLATALNSAALGALITFVVSGVSGIPTSVTLTLNTARNV